MRSLVLPIVLALGTLPAAAAGEANTPPLPPSVREEPWFAAHCGPLIQRQTARWSDVARWRVSYVWESAAGYLWDWQNNANAGQSGHYCTRLTFFDRANQPVSATNFLCSVTHRGAPTEAWTFGNAEVAKRLCRVDPAVEAAMDRSAAKRVSER